MRLGRKRGGRKESWPESTRARALELADRDGAEVASAATGVPAGTIRSWARRKVLAEEKAKVNLSGLEAVKAAGRAIVEAHQARLERYGPPPLAPGEYLSPDPYEGQRPPPGTPWPPVDDEAPPVEPEDES